MVIFKFLRIKLIWDYGEFIEYTKLTRKSVLPVTVGAFGLH